MYQVASLRLLSVRLDILAQPEGVVDGGVDVAAGDGVADTVEAEAAVRVAHRLLRPAGGERVVVDGAEVGAERPQIEVEVDERQSAVLHHELVALSRLHGVGITGTAPSLQPVCAGPGGPGSHSDGDRGSARTGKGWAGE